MRDIVSGHFAFESDEFHALVLPNAPLLTLGEGHG